MTNRKLGEKGFFFTVDAFLSLTFVTAVVLLALFHMSNVQLDSWNSIDLRTATNDALVVMEKSGSLDDAFKLNNAGDEIITASALPILDDLNKTSQSYCFEFIIFDSGDISEPVFHVMKPDCSKESYEFASVERPLVVVKEGLVKNYVVRLGGWRK